MTTPTDRSDRLSELLFSTVLTLDGVREDCRRLHDMNAFQREVAIWGARTFPAATLGAALAHLRRELSEIEADPADPVEWADAIILLLHASLRFGGMEWERIVAAAREKFVINQQRQWGEPDAEGVVEHVRESGTVLHIGPGPIWSVGIGGTDAPISQNASAAIATNRAVMSDRLAEVERERDHLRAAHAEISEKGLRCCEALKQAQAAEIERLTVENKRLVGCLDGLGLTAARMARDPEVESLAVVMKPTPSPPLVIPDDDED